MRVQGVVYRAHDPRWAWSPLSGEGARRFGGRFNKAGIPTLLSAGFAGMRARSYAEGAGVGDANLVLWRWGDALPHGVALIDDERRLRASLRGTR
ncbi:MAG: RES domain-containing protein [Gammaproteobacteria bacterium]|nr:RES domain-containing protein [Gammaproteobacteria bacterium]